MITERERIELRKLFQGNYTSDVLLILNEKKIFNKNGSPFNVQYIRMVFQGVRKNQEIESAIWQLAVERKQEIDQQKSRKDLILKNIP